MRASMAMGETFYFQKAWSVMWQRFMEELVDLEVWHKEKGWGAGGVSPSTRGTV